MKIMSTYLKNKDVLLQLLLIFLILINIIIFGLAFYTKNINSFYFFNSDSLYIPSLYKDLFHNSGSFWSWFLTPAPYFFPDMLLYIVSSIAYGDNSYVSIATFGILQLSLTFLISYFIFKHFFDTTLSLIFCLFLGITITPLAIQSFGVFKYSTFSAFHYGATLSALLCTLMFFHFFNFLHQKISESGKLKRLFILLFSGIIGISITSDKLFLLIFLVPFFLYWLCLLISIIKDFEIGKRIKVISRNSIIGLIFTAIFTGLTGDKAIATEELIFGFLSSIVLTFIFYYLQPKIKSKDNHFTQFDQITFLLFNSIVLSIIFTKILVVHTTEYLNFVFGFQIFGESLDIIKGFFKDLLEKDFLVFSCILTSLILGFFVIFHYCFFREKSYKSCELMQKKAMLLALISTGGSIITVIVTCMNESWHVGDRYVISIFIIPFIAFFPLVKYFLIESQVLLSLRKLKKYLQFLALALLLIVVVSNVDLSKSILSKASSGEIYTEYYPSEMQCLDQVIQKYDLKEGISAYWHAKWAYILSKHDITMAQYDYKHKPMTWITSNGWYRDEYDFALIVTLPDYDPGFNLDKTALIDLNGEPEIVVTCPTFDVLAYPTRKLRIKPIEQP